MQNVDYNIVDGVGNDTVAISAVLLNAADTINGGLGTDTLKVGATGAFTVENAANISGFEVLESTGMNQTYNVAVLNSSTNVITKLVAGSNIGASDTIAASAPVVVASNGSPATANDGLIFLMTGAGEVLPNGTGVFFGVSSAVTALTSGTDFAASNVAVGDSMILVMSDGNNSFIYHYLADADDTHTTAADLQLIGIAMGVNGAGLFMTGDFI